MRAWTTGLAIVALLAATPAAGQTSEAGLPSGLGLLIAAAFISEWDTVREFLPVVGAACVAFNEKDAYVRLEAGQSLEGPTQDASRAA